MQKIIFIILLLTILNISYKIVATYIKLNTIYSQIDMKEAYNYNLSEILQSKLIKLNITKGNKNALYSTLRYRLNVIKPGEKLFIIKEK